MIDWKDVNKELPEEDSNVIVWIKVSEDDMKESFLSYGTFGGEYFDLEHGSDGMFDNTHSDKLNGVKITHWSYINKPDEE